MSLIGLFREAKDILDYGIVFTGFSFFFLNGLVIRKAIFTPYYVLVLSAMFFLLYGNLVYSHRAILMKTIADETKGKNDHLEEFKMGSLTYLLFTLSLSFFITFMGSYVAWYGSVGFILTSDQASLFLYSLLLSLPVIVLIYILTEYIPDFAEKIRS